MKTEKIEVTFDNANASLISRNARTAVVVSTPASGGGGGGNGGGSGNGGKGK